MKKRHLLVIVAAVALLAVTCGGSGTNSATPTGSGSASPSGEPATPVTLTFWHGYTDVEADSLKALLDQWNAENPNIHIKPLFVNNDKALQKLTVALQGGEPLGSRGFDAARSSVKAGARTTGTNLSRCGKGQL